jgi:ATP-dependent Clp protease ATP-binding subunit ClpC
LIDNGYNKNFGARPLKRAIEKYIINPISEEILTDKISNNSNIVVSLAEDKQKLLFVYLML